VVLQYEYFDTATAKEARRAAEKPPTIINMPSSRASEWFLFLNWISVVTNVPKVANALVNSKTGSELRVQASGRG